MADPPSSAAPRLSPGGRILPRPRLHRTIRRFCDRIPRDAPLSQHEFGVFSQNGEDGVLQHILRVLGAERHYFVEFGIGTGDEGNCVLLADSYGWSGVFLEPDPMSFDVLRRKYARNRRVTTVHTVVTADNVEDRFRAAGVPADFDVLSIDIDGNDFWVWKAITSFRPRVVVIEYNSGLPLDRQFVMPRDDGHAWDGTDYFGASLAAYRALAGANGYELVHTERTGANAFFVRSDDAPRICLGRDVEVHSSNYLGRGLAMPVDPRRRPFLDLESDRLVDPR